MHSKVETGGVELFGAVGRLVEWCSVAFVAVHNVAASCDWWEHTHDYKMRSIETHKEL